jgi:hypothetical protein
LKKKIKSIFGFFPITLIAATLRYNIASVLLWFFLMFFITGTLGFKFGIFYLFVEPEYLNKVNFLSFFWVGIASGVFISAYNISGFLTHMYRFPFLLSTQNPYRKFSINNFAIPLIFNILWILILFQYQWENHFFQVKLFIENVFFLLLGQFVFVYFTQSYFYITNRVILKFLGFKDADFEFLNFTSKNAISEIENSDNKAGRELWKVETYLIAPFKIRRTRLSFVQTFKNLNKLTIQNTRNAILFELFILILIFFLGSFSSNHYFILPSAVAIFLLFTVIILVTSALNAWLRGFTFPFYLLLFLIFDGLSKKQVFQIQSYLSGLNYQKEVQPYHPDIVNTKMMDANAFNEDYNIEIKSLENWKKQFDAGSKPKMVVVCSSGGGLRAGYWTFYSLQKLDFVSNSKFFKHIKLISGSSGGLIGAAFFRELRIKKMKNDSISLFHPSHYKAISSDLLNPVTFNLITHDLFFRQKEYQFKNKTYHYNRAAAFDFSLINNLNGSFSNSLSFYSPLEQAGVIPKLLFSPVITIDGKRLLVSANSSVYMCRPLTIKNVNYSAVVDQIDYISYFSKNDASQTQLASLLRANATFPFVFPPSALPTNPPTQIMDAGLRDNFGIKNAIKYLQVFNDWITENTSGIILLVFRDKKKKFTPKLASGSSLASQFLNPIGNFYNNFDKVQTYEYDELLDYASGWTKFDLQVLEFELENDNSNNVSMSWHLTEREKLSVKKSLYERKNIEALQLTMKQLGFRLNNWTNL